MFSVTSARLVISFAIAATIVSIGQAQTRSAVPQRVGDVEGVWDFSMLTPLQRPTDYRDKKYVASEAAALFERSLRQATRDRLEQAGSAGAFGGGVDEEVWAESGSLASINGRFPTSLIVNPPDGRMPALTTDAQRRVGDRRLLRGRLDAAQDRSLSERCLRAVSGPPYLPSPDANTLRIVQSPDDIALTVEKFGETRIVSLRRERHASSQIRSWSGDAIGRWDQSTLVVDTVHFTPAIGLTGNYDGNLHLVEHFTRVDANTLLYEATIDDATAFVSRWTMAVPMKKTANPLYEFACHESNYSMRNMLSAARAEERQR